MNGSILNDPREKPGFSARLKDAGIAVSTK